MSRDMKPSDLAVLADLGFPNTAQRIEMHLEAMSMKEDWLVKSNRELQDENFAMTQILQRISRQGGFSSDLAYETLSMLGKRT